MNSSSVVLIVVVTCLLTYLVPVLKAYGRGEDHLLLNRSREDMQIGVDLMVAAFGSLAGVLLAKPQLLVSRDPLLLLGIALVTYGLLRIIRASGYNRLGNLRLTLVMLPNLVGILVLQFTTIYTVAPALGKSGSSIAAVTSSTTTTLVPNATTVPTSTTVATAITETPLYFLGFNATEWATIASVVVAVLTLFLVLLTATYVILTARLAGSSTRSAQAAEAAAQSAKEAVEASLSQIAIAEAALSIDFEALLNVEYDEDLATGEPIEVVRQLELTCRGATVFVYAVAAELVFFVRSDKRFSFTWQPRQLDIVDPDVKPPLQRHRGEQLVCTWPGAIPRKDDKTRHARISIEYSILENGPRKTLTREVQMPSSDIGLPNSGTSGSNSGKHKLLTSLRQKLRLRNGIRIGRRRSVE